MYCFVSFQLKNILNQDIEAVENAIVSNFKYESKSTTDVGYINKNNQKNCGITGKE